MHDAGHVRATNFEHGNFLFPFFLFPRTFLSRPGTRSDAVIYQRQPGWSVSKTVSGIIRAKFVAISLPALPGCYYCRLKSLLSRSERRRYNVGRVEIKTIVFVLLIRGLCNQTLDDKMRNNTGYCKAILTEICLFSVLGKLTLRHNLFLLVTFIRVTLYLRGNK